VYQLGILSKINRKWLVKHTFEFLMLVNSGLVSSGNFYVPK